MLTMSVKSADRAIRTGDPQNYGRHTFARSDTEEAIIVSSYSQEETQSTGFNEETVTSPIAVISGSEEEADIEQDATSAAVETQKAQSLHLTTILR